MLFVFAAILVILFNPQGIPFLSDDTVMAIRTSTANMFESETDGKGALFVTLPKVVNLFIAFAIVFLCKNILNIIIKRCSPKNSRSQTVASLLVSVVKYTAAFVVIVWGLSILGVNLTGIFASLGILGLVVGFGAQSLIEDIITGVFIIFEGQYNIGDIIILDDFRGVVRKIGVRTTTIEDVGGNVKIVNNSDIRNLQNRSNNTSVAICDVGISYDESLPRVEKILNDAFPAILKANEDVFKDKPILRGVQELGASAVILRITVDTSEENIFISNRRLNREIKLLFDKNKIEIPFNQLVLHDADKK